MLCYLSVNFNPLENPPIEIAQQGIKAIRDYFRQLEDEGEDYIYGESWQRQMCHCRD